MSNTQLPKRRKGMIVVILGFIVSLLLSGCGGGMLAATIEATGGDDDSGGSGACYDGGGGGGSATGNDNTERIYNFMTSSGFSPEFAAGVAGNVMSESSGGNPGLAEYGYESQFGWDVPPNRLRGWGIVQWTWERHDGVRQHVKDKLGKEYYVSQYSSPTADQFFKDNPGSEQKLLEAQLEYLLKELNGPYKDSVLEPMKRAGTPEEAADIFVRKFEIPANVDQTSKERQKQARDLYEKYKNGASGSGGGSDSGSSGSDDSGSTSNSSDQWHWMTDFPVTNTSPYGMRVHPITGVNKLHDGIDYAGGGNLYALADGEVLSAGMSGGFGNRVVFKLYTGQVVAYNHLASMKVSQGQKLKNGDVIGVMGTTGMSTGVHLHFNVYKEGATEYVKENTIDPAPWLEKNGLDSSTGKPNGNSPQPGGGGSVGDDCPPGGDGGGGSGSNNGIIVKDGEIKNGGFYGKVCANECAQVEGKKVTIPNAQWAGEWKGQTIEAPTEQAAYALASSFAYIGMQYSWGGGNGAGPTKGCGGDCAIPSAIENGDPNRIGFDCSGLVGFAWYNAGGSIKITPSTRTVVSEIVAGNVGGKTKSEKDMVPGDVINTGFGNWHHTALYVGEKNGTKYWMEAPKPGAFLRIVPVREVGGWHVTSFASEDGKVHERK